MSQKEEFSEKHLKQVMEKWNTEPVPPGTGLYEQLKNSTVEEYKELSENSFNEYLRRYLLMLKQKEDETTT